ncbi:MAG: hypothetical protein PF450_15890, partial [Bacteroidales bacterium]|nr:hypothetical protein [Bacteroidales bacterium]
SYSSLIEEPECSRTYQYAALQNLQSASIKNQIQRLYIQIKNINSNVNLPKVINLKWMDFVSDQEVKRF